MGSRRARGGRVLIRGPSTHLSWSELACWNRLGRSWQGFAAGELVAGYPEEWRLGRAYPLAISFEALRTAAGNVPIYVNSAFRTPEYNAAVGGARASQHVQGRALDLRHSKLTSAELYALVRHMIQAGKLPHVGGVGRYQTFVHVDVRPKTSGRVAYWASGPF